MIKTEKKKYTKIKKAMKAKLMTIAFAVITAFVVSACADDSIAPVRNDPPTGSTGSGDQCQFGGPGCPK